MLAWFFGPLVAMLWVWLWCLPSLFIAAGMSALPGGGLPMQGLQGCFRCVVERSRGLERVLWTSFLLIGSITCAPQGGSDPTWMYLTSNQAPARPTPEKPRGQASGSGTYRSPGSHYSSGTNIAGAASPSGSGPALYSTNIAGGSGPTSYSTNIARGSGPASYSTNTAGGAGQHGAQKRQSGVPGSQQQVSEESWTSPDGEEPVFTPVSDEDQVYAYKSRSRYNKNRFLFSQSRYTKTEPLHPQELVFPYPGKTSQQSKGGF
ncbi:uncharacterized protein LOC133424177 [Cololabis saira]|uniref:uncharacterized protein LOC133424177 n=1 Tax=Cololabis saira TaxID=129043 RepID=UPI002AD21C55|nr:uncharacterized protein LOC133424177 [Cololabis saira]